MEMKSGTDLWHRHPHVRSGGQLSFGERAADLLKKWFGTWTALGGVAFTIAVWILLQHTAFRWDVYPFILLNLCLSCLAAVQGIILQISANRGDRIDAEVANATQVNTQKLLDLQEEQIVIIRSLSHVNDELDLIKEYLGVESNER